MLFVNGATILLLEEHMRIVENVTHWTYNTVRILGKFTVVCDHDKRKSAFSLVRETQASTEGNDSRIIYGTTK